ncbi:uncharacterized protein LOC112637721 [Camponotus floridanus]|uniref:uncharacterized protein LOC112637721 n=1 Tax=Camponotus floridanus TaxID=104421 RepID=UPI000DC68BD8|nr:uncharacterized protein LOC112637721 [Camponotus floridanus]
MDEIELDEFPCTEDECTACTAPRSSLCWQCESNVNKTYLISPCDCANVYIHDYCLEAIANISDILFCPFCSTFYPLEIRSKSLLKMLWKVCISLFIISFFVCINCITGLIIYLTLSIDVQNQITFIAQIIVLGLFFWFICMAMRQIVDSSMSIYEYYHQWYKSTNEWRLIRPSTDNNIEEYNIEE